MSISYHIHNQISFWIHQYNICWKLTGKVMTKMILRVRLTNNKFCYSKLNIWKDKILFLKRKSRILISNFMEAICLSSNKGRNRHTTNRKLLRNRRKASPRSTYKAYIFQLIYFLNKSKTYSLQWPNSLRCSLLVNKSDSSNLYTLNNRWLSN